eukprot:CAMPEP_0198280356 /NCGR_PEP_ID=MMETSP1449-20131203/436_1 /TAXON_ID=420275 /ORGANISM="Attheya septentrionalis, Strain CCMP2084" /LENGTH=460 /DNA_ID=CAMNT_0043975681 /DNA_START=298 /DNA_END=1680 /DNA_ORIENTATION=-
MVGTSILSPEDPASEALLSSSTRSSCSEPLLQRTNNEDDLIWKSNKSFGVPVMIPSASTRLGSLYERGSSSRHVVKREFSLQYHTSLIVHEGWRLFWFLVHGTPSWVLKLVRLMAFVTSLLPAFFVFLWYYATCDRLAVPYKTGTNATSRHVLDVYGSCLTSPFVTNDSVSSSKPVVIFLTGGAWIIGYKMWGALLARALTPFGVLVIIPDYRNFPQTRIDGMIQDVDESIQWTFDNCHMFGGDPNRIVLVGQSAGAHLGSCVIIRKVISELSGDKCDAEYNLPSTYKANQIKGFVPVSGPYNLVTMQEIFHQHGLDRNLISNMFSNKIETHSPVHLMERCKLMKRDDALLSLKQYFPPIRVLHGKIDKTVPYQGSVEFTSCLRNAGLDAAIKLYEGWSHTDLILEAPMGGDHTFHRDIFNLVELWTGNDSLIEFDDSLPVCRSICPQVLITIGRTCNPF